MEEYKVINEDIIPNQQMVFEKKGSIDDLIATAAESTKEMYQHFYPDTTMVRLDADHDLDDKEVDSIVESFDETLGKNKQRLRTALVLKRTVLIFASAEFKKVADRIKKGARKVEYHNPYLPDDKRTRQEVMSNVYYEGGYAYIDLYSPDDDWGDGNGEPCIDKVFAIYWRPVEEKK